MLKLVCSVQILKYIEFGLYHVLLVAFYYDLSSYILGLLLLQMIFPWMFDEIHALRKFKDAAQILAEKQDWLPLYDTDVLNNNKVCYPVIVVNFHELLLAVRFSNGDLNFPTAQNVFILFYLLDTSLMSEKTGLCIMLCFG